jgi:hypothetical protein
MQIKATSNWRRLRLTAPGAFGLSAMCLLFNACSVGQRHTSDATLERNLLDHQAEFEALLLEVQADDKLSMISAREARYADRVMSAKDGLLEMERAGLTRERWARYQQQLNDLGVARVTKDKRDVEFRVDEGSFLNGDSYKGYWYSPNPPEHTKASLDGYRISESDRAPYGGYYVSKPLKGQWRLYLFVSG